MKYENGIHQTRKKQSTYNKESGANMSSCTCSISVYPRPDPKDILINVESDLKIEIERNKNIDGRKTGSCNVTHLPTGMSTKMPFESWDNRIVEISKEAAIQRSQSFTSLTADLRQDMNRVSSFSRCTNGTFP